MGLNKNSRHNKLVGMIVLSQEIGSITSHDLLLYGVESWG